MNSKFAISAVICSYNRSKFIIKAIESIFSQDFDSKLFEVIVVDNNSTDETLNLLAQFKASHPNYNFRFVSETQQGVAFARTRCAIEASGAIVSYLDDDSIARPGWLKNTVEFYERNPNVWSIGGKITPYFLTPIPDWYSKYFFGLVGRFDQGDEVKQLKKQRYPCGANMSFRKEVFEEIGYFNSALGRKGSGLLATEEKDIYIRILMYGKKVYYLPTVEVLHAVEGNKFNINYVHRHSMGIGGGERLRLQGNAFALIKKIIEYIAKWCYAICYGVGFLIKGEWSKFRMLERFRWWVIIGFLFPTKAN
ncbi:MAG: glycosyltransferase family 2 protein [Bacteroidetes bacterium]|nr:glycosyltransferase family 2 protein [Bacteroidota bacterium]